MAALDLSVINATPDKRHLREAREALAGLFAFGDLGLRSAWLYYGSLAAVSRVVGITASNYWKLCRTSRLMANWLIDYSYNRRAFRKQEQNLSHRCRSHLRKRLRIKLRLLKYLPERDWEIIEEGARMIMNLPDAERDSLFSLRDTPTITGESFAAKVQEWGRRGAASPPVESAEKLLSAYIRAAQFTSDMRTFFECGGMQRPLHRIVTHQAILQEAAVGSKICSVACAILADYELYQSQWAALEKQVKIQRSIIKSRYSSFRAAVGDRDGYRCACCKSSEKKLHLDHIIPVTRGGLSVIDNLQFLCPACNNAKRRQVIDFRKES